MDKDITQTAEIAEETESNAKTAKKTAKKSAQAEKPGVFVYIGPNIRGMVQEGTIFGAPMTEVKAQLSAAIEKYPQIAALIVPAETLAECRRDVKTNGTLLHRKYMELLSAE